MRPAERLAKHTADIARLLKRYPDGAQARIVWDNVVRAEGYDTFLSEALWTAAEAKAYPPKTGRRKGK